MIAKKGVEWVEVGSGKAVEQNIGGLLSSNDHASSRKFRRKEGNGSFNCHGVNGQAKRACPAQ